MMLTAREHAVMVYKRHGQTAKVTAAIMGISTERVRQLRRKATRKVNK